MIFAYLPAAPVGHFVFTLGAGVLLRGQINIPERRETALHDLREVAPSFHRAAPRPRDAMLTRVQVGMAGCTPLKRRLCDHFRPRATALEHKRLKGLRPTLAERITDGLGNILIHAPIRNFLDLSRARRVFTGGEAPGATT